MCVCGVGSLVGSLAAVKCYFAVHYPVVLLSIAIPCDTYCVVVVVFILLLLYCYAIICGRNFSRSYLCASYESHFAIKNIHSYF